jgi:hypothetical protein
MGKAVAGQTIGGNKKRDKRLIDVIEAELDEFTEPRQSVVDEFANRRDLIARCWGPCFPP